MFSKLQTTRFMKTATTTDETTVYFADSCMSIASVHHYGLRDKVSKRGLVVKYDACQLSWLNGPAITAVGDILINHLSN
ncbi:hypothetical protein [Serratia ureilytica]|uniref:hypothetical protein n=1 Tax=Serratia ureilytica TaxID=300181 RepID=UPI00386BB667